LFRIEQVFYIIIQNVSIPLAPLCSLSQLYLFVLQLQ